MFLLPSNITLYKEPINIIIVFIIIIIYIIENIIIILFFIIIIITIIINIIIIIIPRLTQTKYDKKRFYWDGAPEMQST